MVNLTWLPPRGNGGKTLINLKRAIKISRGVLGDAANVNYQTLVITVHWQNNNNIIRNEKEERLRNDHFF